MSAQSVRPTGPRFGTALSRVATALQRGLDDPYLLYTATLPPVVISVALVARRPGEIWLALGLSVVAVGAQAMLGRRTGVRGRSLRWSLGRLAVPLVFVAASVELIGGPTLPLLALYAPVVAGAAAIGSVHGWTIAAVAALIYLFPALGSLGSPASVAVHGISLAGVALVLAFGTRRIVRALQIALRDARMAALAERRRARQIQALDVVGSILAQSGPSDELIGQVVETVARRFGYPYVTVYLGDEERVDLVAKHGYTEALASFDASTGVAGRTIRTMKIAFVPDVSADPEYVPGTIAATSLICAPLVVHGRFLGLLNVETIGARRLDETDRSMIGILAARIASAVALGRDRHALAARAQLFRDIGTFASEISATLAVDPMAEVIAEAVGRVVDADLVAVTLLDRSDGRYVVRAIRGGDSRAVGREIAPGDGLAGRAIRDRAVVDDETLSANKLPPSVRELDVPPLTHGLGLPLVRDGVVVGALTIGRVAEGAAFTDLEREGLNLVASHAALAVANAFLHAEVGELAVRDALTGLYNRRYFDETLDRMLASLHRARLSRSRPITAIVFDLDHFGAFNKKHGHQVGDAVLRTFAEVLRARFRASDLVARLGGDEFIAVLDGADRHEATVVAGEVRSALAARHVEAEDGAELQITVSAGCAELESTNPTRESMLRTADVALFMAKRAGRDRVVAA